MSDLSIIHYTSNTLDHVRPGFVNAVRDQILRSVAGEFPIITVSHEPCSFGDKNIVVGPVARGHLQIYKNILTGCLAADTSHVGLAEDDVLFDESHWRTHRPEPDRFAYNFSRWGINTWENPPRFGYRCRPVVNQLIAPRKMLIDAMEERFAKFKGVPESQIPLSHWGDPGRYESRLGVKVRKWEPFASPIPSVVFSHEEAFGFLSRGKRKSIGKFPRTELPGWGSAQKMQDLWNKGYVEKAA